jgi:hypothetical protein
MSTLIHWQQDAREFKYNHAPYEGERSRKLRKPIYSRVSSRGSSLYGFQRRRVKRSS